MTLFAMDPLRKNEKSTIWLTFHSQHHLRLDMSPLLFECYKNETPTLQLVAYKLRAVPACVDPFNSILCLPWHANSVQNVNKWWNVSPVRATAPNELACPLVFYTRRALITVKHQRAMCTSRILQFTISDACSCELRVFLVCFQQMCFHFQCK